MELPANNRSIRTKNRPVKRGFIQAALVCIIFASILFLAAFLLQLTPAKFIQSSICFVCGTFLVLASAFYFSVDALLRAPLDSLHTLPQSLLEAAEIMGDLEEWKRENAKTRTKLNTFLQTTESGLKESADKIEVACNRFVTQAQEDETQSQETFRVQKELSEWQATMVDYLKSQERTLSLPDLSREYRDACQKSTDVLIRAVQSCGLDVIQPKLGTKFDANLHRYDGERQPENEGERQVSEGYILQCTQWGFRNGSHVVLSAAVVTRQDAPPNECLNNIETEANSPEQLSENSDISKEEDNLVRSIYQTESKPE